jgi:hypothetical protein
VIPQFDWSISLGTVIQVAVIIIGFIKIYNAIERRLSGLEMRMDPIWRWFTDNLLDRDTASRTRRNDHR